MRWSCWFGAAVLAVSLSAPASEVLKTTDLPTYKAVDVARHAKYATPFPSSSPSTPDQQWLDRAFAQSKQALRERSENPLSDQELMDLVVQSPSYLNDIAQSVHLLLSYDRLSYASAPLTDDYINGVALNFLDSLDPFKIFFCRKDIDLLLSEPQGAVRSAVQGQDLGWVFKVFDVYRTRQNQFFSQAPRLVEKFTLDANKEMWNPKPSDWAKCRHQSSRWKSSVEDDLVSAWLPNEDLASARQKVLEIYTSSQSDFAAMTKLDVLEVFLRSYAEYVDPHSLYLSPRSKSNYNSKYQNVLDGVGVVWKKDKGGFFIRQVLPNSPASQDGMVVVGDRLVSVGPSPKHLMPVEASWRMEDVLDKMRGPVDSPVVLVLEGANQEQRTVTLVRKSIALSSNAVNSKLVNIQGYRALVVRLPDFYRDPTNPNRLGGSVSSDVRNAIESKSGAFDVVILDLRGNGGGIMSEAIGVTSLFVEKGTVVQVKSSTGTKQIMKVEGAPPVWKGPLMVLIDERSASASEITAASLQDLNRAIVVGHQSYGKGTAQSLFDLDQNSLSPSPVFGQLNVTAMMFFRPQGSSTQFHGVIPDVRIGQSRLALVTTGERSFERALPSASVEPSMEEALPAQGPHPWQARRQTLQNDSARRWKDQPWSHLWSQSLLTDPRLPRALDPTARQQQHQAIKAIQEELQKKIDQQGKELNDGLANDVVLREAIFVAQDAFGGVSYGRLPTSSQQDKTNE